MKVVEFTKITAEVSGRGKITIEYPTQDITVSDLCQAFRTIMVGLTWTNESAGRMLASYLEEYYGELYNVTSTTDE
jgi:hypothetical protein